MLKRLIFLLFEGPTGLNPATMSVYTAPLGGTLYSIMLEHEIHFPTLNTDQISMQYPFHWLEVKNPTPKHWPLNEMTQKSYLLQNAPLFPQCWRLVQQGPSMCYDVYVMHNVCKRSLAICRKSRALCPISRLLSVPILACMCWAGTLIWLKQTNKIQNICGLYVVWQHGN